MVKPTPPPPPPPPRPYDAIIEYLESSGSQYLVIIGGSSLPSITINEDFDFELDSQFLEIPRAGYTGNGFTTGRVQFFYALNSSSSVGLYMAFNGSTNIAQNLSDEKISRHKVEASSRNREIVYKFDKGVVANFIQLPNFVEYFYLFCLANASGYAVGRQWPQRIFASKLSVGGVPYFDLIPVRIGNTGYMYDKVSGQLFGNSGNGDFILGPDIG